MTKDILLSITGMQFYGGEDEAVEVVTAGDYYKRNGKHYILYEEAVEGMSGHISNTVKIGENSMEVMKRGLTNTRMVFEKGKRHISAYQTPYGSVEIGIMGKDIEVKETEERIDIRAEYLLDVNEERLAECTIQMNVRPREAGNLSLRS